MFNRVPKQALNQLQEMLATQYLAPLPDADLLQRFVALQDGAAFGVLLERYGPMVMRVCRQLLGDLHAAEDAFQATFLVLARKAASIRSTASLAGWIYGVARRTAVHERNRPNALPTEATARNAEPVVSEITLREALAALHEELERLPEKYRCPLVLCYLEEKTRDEAVRQLGWPEGTFKRRLERGRELLRERLGRRGLTLSGGLVATLLSADPAVAVPTGLQAIVLQNALIVATGQSLGSLADPAARLAEGVLASMSAHKLKWALAATLALALTGLGAGVVAVSGAGAQATSPIAAVEADPNERQVQDQPKRVDRYGDALPDGAVARLGTIRWRQGDGMEEFALCKNGKLAAVLSGQRLIKLVNLTDGKEFRQIEVDEHPTVTCIALSPDGKRLATAKLSGDIHLWDIASGQREATLPLDRPKGEDQRARGPGIPDQHQFALTFSPDSKSLACCGWQPAVCVWDLARRKVIWKVDSPSDRKDQNEQIRSNVTCLAYSDDGRWLATSGSNESSLTLWDAATGMQNRRFDNLLNAHSIGVSPDGQQLAAVGFDGEAGSVVERWSLATGAKLPELRPAPGVQGAEARDSRFPQFQQYAYSPDGKTLALAYNCDADATHWRVELCDLATGARRGGFKAEGSGAISGLGFLPDGKTVLVKSGAVISLRDAATGGELTQVEGHAEGIGWVSFTTDGKVVTGDATGSRRTWDQDTGQGLARSSGSSQWGLLSVRSADGKVVARRVRHVYGSKKDEANGDILIEDGITGKELRCCRFKSEKAAYSLHLLLALSADGRLLAVADQFGAGLQFWDAETGKPLDYVRPPPLTELAADGSRRAPSFQAIAFSPAGRCLAVAYGSERDVMVWDIVSGREIFRDRTPATVSVFHFSADGRTLVAGTGDGNVQLWEVATGKQRRLLHGHRAVVWSLAFSPDGLSLASGSADTTALVWDVTGRRSDPRSRATRLSAHELESLWRDLAQDSASRAYRASGVLRGSGTIAVEFLRERLKPVEALDAQRLARLLADLDSDRFNARESATKEFERLGDLAVPGLKAQLAANPAVEVQRRIEKLLPEIEHRPMAGDDLRVWRSMEVLEHIGSPTAIQVLETIARGARGHRLTEEARTTLQRLHNRTSASVSPK